MKARVKRVWILIKSEPKRASVLAALVLVGGALWGRAAVQRLNDGDEAQTSASAQTVSEGGPLEALGETPEKTTVAVAAPPPVRRDLFRLSVDHFAPPSQTESLDEDAPKSASGNDDKPDRPRRVFSSGHVVREQAQSLRLRSTVVGTDPIAVIESSLGGEPRRVVLKVGDHVDGFRLLRVDNRRVVLEKQGIEVVLALPMP